MEIEFIKTGYALYKSGYIEEDEVTLNVTEHDSVKLCEDKSKDVLIAFAKKNHLSPDDHYIAEVGYEIIEGYKIPTTGEDEDWIWNYYSEKDI